MGYNNHTNNSISTGGGHIIAHNNSNTKCSMSSCRPSSLLLSATVLVVVSFLQLQSCCIRNSYGGGLHCTTATPMFAMAFSFLSTTKPKTTTKTTATATTLELLHEQQRRCIERTAAGRLRSSFTIDEPLDEDYEDDDEGVNTSEQLQQQKKLGIPLLLDPMTAAEAIALKTEATEMVNDIVAAGIDDMQVLRQQLQDEIQVSQQQRELTSQQQMEIQQAKLLQKIDALTNDFYQQPSIRSSRMSTKMAALADQSISSGQGIEMGTWGMVNGRYVATTDGGVRSATTGLLGSSTTTSSSNQSSSNRMIVIADPSSDSFAKLLLGPLETSLQNVLSSSSSGSHSESSSNNNNNFEMILYKPSSSIPIGNTQNAAAILIFTTSINDVITLQTMMDRIYRTTITPSDGSTTVLPSQIIVITTIGTTRVEKMPFTMQNLMSGNKLTKRRQMEESVIRFVNTRNSNNESPIDYTICHLGSDITKAADTTMTNGKPFQLLPGDTIDGSMTIDVDTAVTVLTHAIALQPYARNAIFSCAGTLPKATTTNTDEDQNLMLSLDDAFLQLDGPEIIRIELESATLTGTAAADQEQSLDALTEYICEWAEMLCTSGGNGLTTPVRFEVVDNKSNDIPSGVRQQSSSIVKILFQPTNTGKYYISKDDERDIISNSDGKSSSPPPVKQSPPPSRLAKEGGLEFVIEILTTQRFRIRVKRCNYSVDTIVKELSEQTIISQFKKCIDVWKKDHPSDKKQK